MLHTSWNKTQFHSGKSSWVYWVSSRYATWRSFHWWRSVPASRCTPSSLHQGQSGQMPLGGGRTNGHRSRSGAGTPPCGSPGNEVVWWRHETLPTILVLCAGKPPVGFTHKRTVRSFDVCFVTSLNKVLDKQSSCRWFESPWCPCDITVSMHYKTRVNAFLNTFYTKRFEHFSLTKHVLTLKIYAYVQTHWYIKMVFKEC